MTRASLPFGVWALAATNFAIGTQSFAFSGTLGLMAQDLAVSEAAIGTLVSLSSVTFAVTAPLLAGRAMRLERRGLLVATMLALGLVNLACAFAPGFASLAALRIAGGLVMGVTGSVASVAAASLVPEGDRGRAFAAVLGGLTASFVIGVPLASVIGSVTGWRGSFGLSAAIAVIAAVVLRASLPRLNGAAPVQGQIAGALRNPAILGLYATIFAAFTATFAIVAFLGPLITADTGLTGAGIGLLQAFIGIGSILGLAMGGRIDPSRGARATRRLFALIAATMLGHLAISATPASLTLAVPLAALILAGAAALFALVPLTMTRIAALAGPAAPVLLALNGSVTALGQGTGAALGGLAAHSLGPIGLAAAGLAVSGTAWLALSISQGEGRVTA